MSIFDQVVGQAPCTNADWMYKIGHVSGEAESTPGKFIQAKDKVNETSGEKRQCSE